jgi:hypothetical protein
MHAAAETTAGVSAETAATAVATATSTAAMAGRHRAGRHRCCKGQGHRACDKLFLHVNLHHDHELILAN